MLEVVVAKYWTPIFWIIYFVIPFIGFLKEELSILKRQPSLIIRLFILVIFVICFFVGKINGFLAYIFLVVSINMATLNKVLGSGIFLLADYSISNLLRKRIPPVLHSFHYLVVSVVEMILFLFLAIIVGAIT